MFINVDLFFGFGNEENIRQAIWKVQYDWLDDPAVVKQKADFALNLQPKDLTLLSSQFGKFSWQRKKTLRPHLTVLFDEIDRGVLLVDGDWVKYVSKVKLKQTERITISWFKAMQKAYPDETIKVSDDGKKAVEELIVLCKQAVHENKQVFHWWYL